jgi:cytochrome d ubiquinol oxidase subunit II
MLIAYVVLDGFDLGVGIVFPFVARTEEERQHALRSIGPVWDGNEVWLLAAGGTLFFAFPLLYASAFSGFYMPLMIVLWLLILRGLSVELRMHVHEPLWRSFFDGLFFFSSSLLAIFFGAALANVIRGVPIGPDNYFYLPLWTDWRTGANPGILDWYTVIGGLMALLALSLPELYTYRSKPKTTSNAAPGPGQNAYGPSSPSLRSSRSPQLFLLDRTHCVITVSTPLLSSRPSRLSSVS